MGKGDATSSVALGNRAASMSLLDAELTSDASDAVTVDPADRGSSYPQVCLGSALRLSRRMSSESCGGTTGYAIADVAAYGNRDMGRATCEAARACDHHAHRLGGRSQRCRLISQVSVILSTFQRPEHLRRSLLSLAVQRGVDGQFEVVVTDDGSTDHTADVVDHFAKSVEFTVRFVTQEHRGFHAARCRNHGVQASRASVLDLL